MLRGILNTRTVLTHPIALFHHFRIGVAIRLIVWALDDEEHTVVGPLLMS